MLLVRLGKIRESRSLDGGTHKPEFLAINPIRKVPTVQIDDRRFLAESNAILLHFAQPGEPDCTS